MADKNQPAFPMGATVHGGNGMLTWEQVPGMTLRQYYAGQALGRMIDHESRVYAGMYPSSVAKLAVTLADALIAELDK